MRRILVPLLTALLLVSPARAEDPAPAIQSVIEKQIAAFQANDLEQAFGYASPTIQQLFQTPANFGRMVAEGYPMVWRPARYEMRELVQTESGPVQVVLFEDMAGRLHEAGYLMRLVGGVWRIGGVKVRRTEGLGT